MTRVDAAIPSATMQAFKPLYLLVMLSFFSLPVSAQSTTQENPQADRLTDLVVEAIPMGRIFELMAVADPEWPMQDNVDAVTPTQLSCLRSELSVAGYRRLKHVDAVEYIKRHPSRIADDLKLLENGSAGLMSRLVMAGAEGERTGKGPSEQEILGSATPAQLAALMAFLTAPDHAELRKLAGIGNGISSGKSAEENRENGRAIGENLAVQAMLKAVSDCNVPTSALIK